MLVAAAGEAVLPSEKRTVYAAVDAVIVGDVGMADQSSAGLGYEAMLQELGW